MKLGVISDTHGLIRPEALAALRTSELILHAGDIGMPEVLDALQDIAPVIAIRGNNDTGRWARKIPATKTLTLEALAIHLVHSVKDLELDPAEANIRVVVSGHSHKPSVERRDGVLYLNPGSAGPRRFKLPISVAMLTINGTRVRARILELDP